jgi:peptidoglycan/LPS O-acetylase OafA/YrhL
MTQLDGLRALAMLAICWDHWWPYRDSRWFPYEVCLYFFLVMTGFLITGSLLRQRDRLDARGAPWRASALREYHLRRGLRILAPYYAALAIAFLLFSEDVWSAPVAYLLHLSNIHMATLPEWPQGTNHFWSLAMQQQFYLVWPFAVWFLPRRGVPWSILALCVAGPVFRYYHSAFQPWFLRPEVLTTHCLDYFGWGALLAWMHHRGMSLENPGLRGAAWLAFAGYLALYACYRLDWPTHGLWIFQTSCVSIALCGFVAAACVGFGGAFGKLLERPVLGAIGAVSYGIYLFHNIAPLVVGKVLWFLWDDPFRNWYGECLKGVAIVVITAALTLASWFWIEQPLQRVREKIRR